MSFPFIALVGSLDYLTGEELSFSIFYLAPIALAAWVGSRRLAILASICGAAVWLAVDLISIHYSSYGAPVWNASVRLGFYLIVAVLLMVVRADRDNLERAVRERTRELEKSVDVLQEEVAQRVAAQEERTRAEREVLESSEREQRRIGRDLHDTIQGNLVGLRMVLSALGKDVAASGVDRGAQFDKLDSLVADTISQTRGLAASLCPADLSEGGLSRALKALAEMTATVFRAPCEFQEDGAVRIADEMVAGQLYFIAREAVSNAIKHARSRKIVIRLGRREDRFVLSVEDDGVGIPDTPVPTGSMGLRTMSYRASLVNACLDVRRGPIQGTIVECRLPAEGARRGDPPQQQTA